MNVERKGRDAGGEGLITLRFYMTQQNIHIMVLQMRESVFLFELFYEIMIGNVPIGSQFVVLSLKSV